MSLDAMLWVLKHSEAKLGDRLVLIVLADRANEDGTGSWPSVADIAERSRLSERQVQRALKRLKDGGHIEEVGKGPNGTRAFNVRLSPPTSAPEGVTSEASGTAQMSPEQSERSSEQTKMERARASLPDGFPEELRPHARLVFSVLRSVAEQHRARVVTPLALGNVMMARPRKPFVKCAYDFAAWAADPPRPIKDTVASYRTFLDRERDLAATEALPGELPPMTGALPSRPKDARRAAADAQVAEFARVAMERRRG